MDLTRQALGYKLLCMETTTTTEKCDHYGTGRLWKDGGKTCTACQADVAGETTYSIRDRNLDPMGGGNDLDRVMATYDAFVADPSLTWGEAPFILAAYPPEGGVKFIR